MTGEQWIDRAQAELSPTVARNFIFWRLHLIVFGQINANSHLFETKTFNVPAHSLLAWPIVAQVRAPVCPNRLNRLFATPRRPRVARYGRPAEQRGHRGTGHKLA